jgi:hypothetical protein
MLAKLTGTPDAARGNTPRRAGDNISDKPQ